MRRSPWQMLTLALISGAAIPAAAQDAIAGSDLPPPGYGTLKQDNVSIRVTSADLDIRFLPLDERLLRLLAPDAYQSLHGLVESRQVAIDSAAREASVSSPGLALVTFYALRPAVQFDPQNLSLLYHNQFYRPAAIVPYTANFGSRQLQVRQQATGIYLFENPLPVFDGFTLVYGSAQSTAWDDVLRRITTERSRVASRWQAERGDTTARKP
jgi:hypothetical protein